MQTSLESSPNKDTLEADLKNCEEALQATPDDPEVWKSKAEILQTLQRDEEAATAWLITAKKYGNEKRAQETITAIRACEALKPTALEIRAELGKLYLRLRLPTKARDIFEAVLQEDKNHLLAIAGLNRYHAEMADYRRRQWASITHSTEEASVIQTPTADLPPGFRNSPYADEPIKKADAIKIRSLMHALWGQYGANTTRHFQAQNPDKIDTSYLESGVYFAPLDPSIHTLLTPCFDEGFALTDPQELEAAGGDNNATLYKPTGETLEQLQAALDLLRPEIDRLLQSHFKIESVICRSISPLNQDAAFKWHKDGYPDTVRRILIWMDSPDVVGGTEIIDWNKKTWVVTGDGPTWVLFDNGPLLHTGHYKGTQNRKTIDITLSPAFETDTTPRIHGPAFVHRKTPLEDGAGLSVLDGRATKSAREAIDELLKP